MCVSFMVSSAPTQQRFPEGPGVHDCHGLLSSAQSTCLGTSSTLSSTILEGDTQAQSGRGAQSRSHSTPRSRAKARTWSLPDQ